jgi:hypothetical protein
MHVFKSVKIYPNDSYFLAELRRQEERSLVTWEQNGVSRLPKSRGGIGFQDCSYLIKLFLQDKCSD